MKVEIKFFSIMGAFILGLILLGLFSPYRPREIDAPVIPEANGQGEFTCERLGQDLRHATDFWHYKCTLEDGKVIDCLISLEGLSCDWP